VAASAGYVGIAEPSSGAKSPTLRGAVARHTRRTHHKPARPARRGTRRRKHRHVHSHRTAVRPAHRSSVTASGAKIISGSQAAPAGAPSEGPTQPGGPTPSEARAKSSTEFENLAPQAAEATLQEKYPQMVDNPSGGPPALAEGQTATGYPSDYSMSVDAGGGKHALVESITPIALETENGGHKPLDLGLHETEGGFQPAAGLAHVRLGRDASEGASLVDRGVSLTPVSEQGAPLGGHGTVDHAGVFYGGMANPQAGVQDLGMLAKPTTEGFEWYSTLFSARSPEHLFFKVGLPEGATLEQGESREVRVMREGQAIAIVSAFSAQDAEGTPVPVTMSLSSADTIELTVARKAGQFRYPLIVDPTMDDTTFLAYLSPAWVSCASGAAKCPLVNEKQL
jgi:hypothetical protein